MSDVFISYAHEDSAFVDRLRSALIAAGRDVWVDVSGIEPADQWRNSAHEAIDRSDSVVFVISRHSLRSDPCLGELGHATETHKRLIPVCVDQAAADMDKPDSLAELSWVMMRPEDGFDAGVAAIGHALDTDLDVVRAHTRILVRARAWELAGRRTSPLLRGEELRAAEQWLARAAAAGSPPTELQQQFIVASRHAASRRLRTLAGVAVAVAVVAIVLSIFALIQRSRAIQEASVATSRQLAALSESELRTNLQAGLLLAVQSYRTNPNPQTRAALLQADLASPSLQRFVPMGGQVTALAGSADRTTLVAGLSDGRVMRWHGGAPAALASLGAPVNGVAVSADGAVAVAVSTTRALLWRDGRVSFLSCPAAQRPGAVGVSPSGVTVLLHCRAAAGHLAQSIEEVDGRTGLVTATHPVTGANFVPDDLVVSSDSSALLFDGADGPWQVRSLPGWALTSASNGSLGVHQGLSGFSPDGRFVTATNSAPTIPVWPTSSPTSFDPTTAPLTAQAPISAASTLAISPGGSELAAGDSGTIYVAPVSKPGTVHPSPFQLTGNGSINPATLGFTGDDRHLVSASGAVAAIWNLNHFDRLATAFTTALPSPCNGCPGALAAISPDGRRLAAVADNGEVAVIQAVTGGPAQLIQGYGLAAALWDGPQLLLIEQSPPGSAPPPLPAGVRVLALPQVTHPPAAGQLSLVTAGLIDAGREVAVVDAQGNVYVQSVATGRLLYKIPGPHDLSLTTAQPLFGGQAAVDPATGLVALDDNDTVRLVDALTRRRLGVVGVVNPTSQLVVLGGVAFAGPHLLIEHSDGSLEVYNARGTIRQRLIVGDASYASYAPVGDPSGQLVARQRTDGTVVLDDLSSGSTLATLPAPAPTDLELRIGLAFTPGGRGLVSVVQTVSGSTPFIIHRPLDVPTLIRTACETAGQNLTAAQWRTFVGTNPPADLACR